MSNRYVHVERKAGHTVHDTVSDAYAPFVTDDDAESATSLLNIFGDVLGFDWVPADVLAAVEAKIPVDPDDPDQKPEDSNGDAED